MDSLNSGSLQAVPGKRGARSMLIQYGGAAPLASRSLGVVSGRDANKTKSPSIPNPISINIVCALWNFACGGHAGFFICCLAVSHTTKSAMNPPDPSRHTKDTNHLAICTLPSDSQVAQRSCQRSTPASYRPDCLQCRPRTSAKRDTHVLICGFHRLSGSQALGSGFQQRSLG